jgi:Capsule assembly protein Wzi
VPSEVQSGPTNSLPAYGQAPVTGTTAAPTPQQGPTPSTTPGPATPQQPVKAFPQYGPPEKPKKPETPALSSSYIPDDSWMYPALTRLYSLGYLDTAFLGMRPWTRLSVLHMVLKCQQKVVTDNNSEAVDILNKLLNELEDETQREAAPGTVSYGTQSAYTRFMGIGGSTLRDSFHLGQTIENDYGRPYQTGFNNITGVSGQAEWWRLSLYVRGEYQYAPSGTGYSYALSNQLSTIDEIPYGPPNYPQDTIPSDPIKQQSKFSLVEGSLSFHVLGHEISGGKSDAWLGPAQGGSMAWSNNAENIYSFRINRVEPLYIPFLSKLTGPLRYDFFYGDLKGHTYPNEPWVHSEQFSFKPTDNFTFQFQRTIIFAGKGHAPVTLHTFLNGFFSTVDTTVEQKFSREDPGARFTTFTTDYRIPYLRKYLTFYLDAMAHDDVTPISAPRRASYRTGLYLSKFPGLNKLDFRVEGISTDPNTSRSNGGQFNYFEIVQRQGYTNHGMIMGDWIGREAKGGQAWLTYHFSGNEYLQFSYLNKKVPKDFIPLGTTQNQYKITLVKRFKENLEVNAWFQYEGWKAPDYKTGLQKNTVTAVQLTWYPKLQLYPTTK